jgi:hypothetical protein
MRQSIVQAMKSPRGGVRVFLPKPTSGLSSFRALKAKVYRPDGSLLHATAYKTFVFWESRPVPHREAFVLRGVELNSIPERSSIEITLA